MHLNWLEKPSVEQNNHSFLKWLGRGILLQILTSFRHIQALSPRDVKSAAEPQMGVMTRDGALPNPRNVE